MHARHLRQPVHHTTEPGAGCHALAKRGHAQISPRNYYQNLPISTIQRQPGSLRASIPWSLPTISRLHPTGHRMHPPAHDPQPRQSRHTRFLSVPLPDLCGYNPPRPRRTAHRSYNEDAPLRGARKMSILVTFASRAGRAGIIGSVDGRRDARHHTETAARTPAATIPSLALRARTETPSVAPRARNDCSLAVAGLISRARPVAPPPSNGRVYIAFRFTEID
jgi:hypothetical protein